MRDSLLIVDDCPPFVDQLLVRMTTVHCDVVARFEHYQRSPYNAALVALDCSNIDGISVVRSLRSHQDHWCSILAYSAKDFGLDSVLAYEAGADDCFARGAEMTVIEAKVRRALARSTRPEQRNGLDEMLGSVERELTRFEHRLLQLLASNREGVVSKEKIAREMWGRQHADPKLIYEHVSTLRAKLAHVGWTLINVRGRGYRLEPKRDLKSPKAPDTSPRTKAGTGISRQIT